MKKPTLTGIVTLGLAIALASSAPRKLENVISQSNHRNPTTQPASRPTTFPASAPTPYNFKREGFYEVKSAKFILEDNVLNFVFKINSGAIDVFLLDANQAITSKLIEKGKEIMPLEKCEYLTGKVIPTSKGPIFWDWIETKYAGRLKVPNGEYQIIARYKEPTSQPAK